MALQAVPNCTAKIFRGFDRNNPLPATSTVPAVVDVPGVLAPWVRAGRFGFGTVGLKWTSVLLLDPGVDVRASYDAQLNPWDWGQNADTIVIENHPCVGKCACFVVVMIERADRGTPEEHLRVYLDRARPLHARCPCYGEVFAWWKFDEGNGTLARDSSKFARHGTLLGGPTWVQGIAGPCLTTSHALEFDGTDDVVEVPNLDIDTSVFSVAAWIQRGRPGAADAEAFVFSKGDGGWGFGLYPSDFLVLSQMGFGRVLSTGTIADTAVHHVAVTYDGSDVAFYIDGALDSAGTYGVGFTGGDVYGIGGRNGATGNFFQGVLDDVRVYCKVLSADEIAALACVE